MSNKVQSLTDITAIASGLKVVQPRKVVARAPSPTSKAAAAATPNKQQAVAKTDPKPAAAPAAPAAKLDEVPGATTVTGSGHVLKERLTVSSDARAKIAEGYTRQQLWDHLHTQWKLPESKKGYASWYFAEAKRAGRLTCECKGFVAPAAAVVKPGVKAAAKSSKK